MASVYVCSTPCHNSQKVTPLFVESLKFITHGRICERLHKLCTCSYVTLKEEERGCMGTEELYPNLAVTFNVSLQNTEN